MIIRLDNNTTVVVLPGQQLAYWCPWFSWRLSVSDDGEVWFELERADT